MEMKEKNSTLILVFVMALSFVFPVSSWFCFWADSEIWSLRSSNLLFSRFNDFSFSTKMLFHVFLHFTNRVSDAFFPDFDPLFLSRLLFSINALFITYVTSKLTYYLTNSTKIALLTSLFVLCDTFFISRGFRIRADLLAFSSFLVLLLFFFKRPSFLSPRKITLSIALCFIPMLFTLKAIYLTVILIGSLIFMHIPLNKKSIQTLISIIFIFSIFSLSIPPIQRVFLEGWSYFMSTLSHFEVGVSYFSWWRIEYFNRWLLENKLKVLLWLISIVTFMFLPKSKFIKHQKAFKICSTISIILFLILIVHPNPLPFFIASYSPLFAVLSSIGLYQILKVLEHKYSPSVSYVLLLTMITMLVVPALNRHQKIIFSHNNDRQKEIMTIVNSYLQKNPHAKIFDSIGISKGSTIYPWFIGPGERHKHKRIIENIKSSQVNLILYTRKFDLINPHIGIFLNDNFAYWNKGVFIRAITKPFENGQSSLKTLKSDIISHWPSSEILVQASKKINKTSLSSKFNFYTNKAFSIKVDLIDEKDVINFNESFGILRISPLPPLDVPYLISDVFRFDYEI